jgi:hypothetical protein
MVKLNRCAVGSGVRRSLLSPSKLAYTSLTGRVVYLISHCARRATPLMLHPSSLVSLFGGWPGRSSIARVERAPSERARSASRRTTRLPSSPPPSFLVTSYKGAGSRVLNCARPTRAFRGRAFREHGGPASLPRHTHSGAYSFPASFSANHRYRPGSTNSVRAVEVKRPPITTVASGRCTSAPIP